MNVRRREMAFRNHPDAAHLLVNTLDMILSITSTVYEVVEGALELADKNDKDKFTLCTLAIDNGIIDIVSIALGAMVNIEDPKIILDSGGNITIKGSSVTDVASASHVEVNTPTPAIEAAALGLTMGSKVFDMINLGMKAADTIANFVSDAKKEDMEEL
jgi:hypothetical protein